MLTTIPSSSKNIMERRIYLIECHSAMKFLTPLIAFPSQWKSSMIWLDNTQNPLKSQTLKDHFTKIFLSLITTWFFNTVILSRSSRFSMQLIEIYKHFHSLIIKLTKKKLFTMASLLIIDSGMNHNI